MFLVTTLSLGLQRRKGPRYRRSRPFRPCVVPYERFVPGRFRTWQTPTGLLKRSPFCNHLKHVASSTKIKAHRHLQVAMFRCFYCKDPCSHEGFKGSWFLDQRKEASHVSPSSERCLEAIRRSSGSTQPVWLPNSFVGFTIE